MTSCGLGRCFAIRQRVADSGRLLVVADTCSTAFGGLGSASVRAVVFVGISAGQVACVASVGPLSPDPR
jgi:hypothetical protein